MKVLLALLSTLLLEACVIAVLTRKGERRAALRVCLALNLFTHPFATLLAWRWSADVVALEAKLINFSYYKHKCSFFIQ